jgi:hypothetical protein
LLFSRANAYYFWNSKTNETTWTNPVMGAAPSAAAAAAASSSTSSPAAATTAAPSSTAATSSRPSVLPTADDLGGIDPDLAYLDPSLSTGASSGGGPSAPTFQARFNARTGRFEKSDARTPEHVGEFARYKRQNEFFFDVGSWERQVEEEQAKKREAEERGEDAKRKRLSKAQVVRRRPTPPFSVSPFLLTQTYCSKRSRKRRRKRRPQSSAHGFSARTIIIYFVWLALSSVKTRSSVVSL